MRATKIALVLLGILVGMLIVWQLTSGILMITQEEIRLKVRTAHQHAGYMTATLGLIYIAASIAVILNLPSSFESEVGESEATSNGEESR